MSVLSQLFRKNKVKDKIRQQIDKVLTTVQSKLYVYFTSTKMLTDADAQKLTNEIMDILRAEVDRIW